MWERCLADVKNAESAETWVKFCLQHYIVQWINYKHQESTILKKLLIGGIFSKIISQVAQIQKSSRVGFVGLGLKFQKWISKLETCLLSFAGEYGALEEFYPMGAIIPTMYEIWRSNCNKILSTNNFPYAKNADNFILKYSMVNFS